MGRLQIQDTRMTLPFTPPPNELETLGNVYGAYKSLPIGVRDKIASWFSKDNQDISGVNIGDNVGQELPTIQPMNTPVVNNTQVEHTPTRVSYDRGARIPQQLVGGSFKPQFEEPTTEPIGSNPIGQRTSVALSDYYVRRSGLPQVAPKKSLMTRLLEPSDAERYSQQNGLRWTNELEDGFMPPNTSWAKHVAQMASLEGKRNNQMNGSMARALFGQRNNMLKQYHDRRGTSQEALDWYKNWFDNNKQQLIELGIPEHLITEPSPVQGGGSQMFTHDMNKHSEAQSYAKMMYDTISKIAQQGEVTDLDYAYLDNSLTNLRRLLGGAVGAMSEGEQIRTQYLYMPDNLVEESRKVLEEYYEAQKSLGEQAKTPQWEHNSRHKWNKLGEDIKGATSKEELGAAASDLISLATSDMKYLPGDLNMSAQLNKEMFDTYWAQLVRSATIDVPMMLSDARRVYKLQGNMYNRKAENAKWDNRLDEDLPEIVFDKSIQYNSKSFNPKPSYIYGTPVPVYPVKKDTRKQHGKVTTPAKQQTPSVTSATSSDALLDDIFGTIK